MPYISLIGYTNTQGNTYSYLKNAHGDITGTVNASGRVSASFDYDAYGNKLTSQVNPTPFGYSGEYCDAETGLIYLRARYYDPSSGRFISEDPIRDGVNWYAYCAGDPVNFVDPSGESIVSIREFVESRGGIVEWDGFLGQATFELNEQVLVIGRYGDNNYGFE